MSLPKELSGWDTGTVCITAPVKVEPVGDADFDWQEKKLVLSTTEAKEKISSRHAEKLGDNQLQWNVEDDIRLPTYDRYSSALYFDYGGSKVKIGPLGTKVEAFAMLCELESSLPCARTPLTSRFFSSDRALGIGRQRA